MNLRNAAKRGVPYSIGLDLGTGSVGWAVIGEDGELLHFKGRPTWGSRLFPSASPASEARVHRGQRRRYDRRRQRLNLLQDFFKPAMAELDPDFFIRLNQSRLLKEDRDPEHSDYRWPIFNESDFTERDYYRRFPTIYHLRKYLTEVDEQADLRLVYLALHNIVKARGNFLWQDSPHLSARNADTASAIDSLCDALKAWCEERELDGWDEPDRKAIHAVLGSPRSRADKQHDLAPLLRLGRPNDRMAKAISKAIFGYKVEFGDIFGVAAKGEGSSFSLDDDDKVEAFLALCPDDGVELFESLQKLRSAIILMSILEGGDGKTISFYKVRQYEQYHDDLNVLKQLVREYVPDRYDAFFRGAHYADSRWAKDYDPAQAQGYTLYNLNRARAYEDFRKDVQALFKGTDAADDSRYVDMMTGFAEEKFLRRLKTSDNGSIPFQLHLEEMRAIIDRQGRYYPFLLNEREKIESLVSFRIPYYVGPLTQKNAAVDTRGRRRFAWSERIAGEAG